MADYLKMYAILCKTIDSVIDPLNQIPLAIHYAALLEHAILEAEDVYCETEDLEDTDECLHLLNGNRGI